MRRRERVARLFRATARHLSEQAHAVLQQKFVDGLGYKKIAARNGLTQANVRQIVLRSLATLRDVLGVSIRFT